MEDAVRGVNTVLAVTERASATTGAKPPPPPTEAKLLVNPVPMANGQAHEPATAFPPVAPAPQKTRRDKLPVKEILAKEIQPLLLTPEEAALARECGLEVCGDEAMEKAWRKLVNFAPTDMVMLIRGESGTGKEPFSQAVHRIRHKRKTSKQMVIVNSAALNEGIVESELFGHMRGAFTGAIENRVGKFQEAHEGTLLFDEIGDMPLNQQPKLLRVLEEKKITPAGSNKPVDVNVKVVCATNCPLEQMIEKKLFRLDLARRLKACQIQLPAWRHRTLEHRVMVVHFLCRKLMNQLKSGHTMEFTDEAWQLLMDMPFHGNVRELVHLLERTYHTIPKETGTEGPLLIDEEQLRASIEQEGTPNESAMERYGDLQYHELERMDDGRFRLRLAIDLPLVEGMDDVKARLMELLSSQVLKHVKGRHVGNTAQFLRLSRRSVTGHVASFNSKTRDQVSGAAEDGKVE